MQFFSETGARMGQRIEHKKIINNFIFIWFQIFTEVER